MEEKVKKTRVSREKLFNYFFEFGCSEDEINKMILSLSEDEVSFLRKVYGENLTEAKGKLGAKDSLRLNNLFTKMKKLLNVNKKEVNKVELNNVLEIDDMFLEKLYIYFCEHDFASIDELTREGYSKGVIATLVGKDILKIDNNLNYSLSESQVEDLLRLSKIKGSVGDNLSSFLFIKKCSQLEPDNDTFKFFVFAKSISANQNIGEIMEYFDVLSQGNDKYQNDLNFYLLLLSYSYQLPKKYVDRLYSMNFNDIAYKDKNSIRSAVFLGRIPYAHKLIDLKLQEKGKSAQLILTKYLLLLAVHKYYDMNLEVCNLLKEEKYQEIIKIYDNISNSRPLNNREFHEKRLTKALVENIDLIPKENKNNYNTWLEALDNDDIDAAYEIAGRKNWNKSKYLYLLLKKLIAKEKTYADEITVVVDGVDEQVVSVDNVIDTRKIVFGEVVSIAFNGGLPDILKAIHQYLNSYGKLDYFDVIVDYMRLSVLNNEKYYESVLPLISNLETMSSKINIYDIVQKFYEALSINQLSIANVYLQLIIDLKEAGLCLMSDSDISKIKLSRDKFYFKSSSVSELEDFEQVVNAFSRGLSTKVTSVGKVLTIESSVIRNVGPVESVSKIILEKDVKPARKKRESEVNITDNFDMSGVLDKIKAISDDHIIILNPMIYSERRKVYYALKERSDVYSFYIGDGNDKRIVVKYQVPQIESYALKEMIFDADRLSVQGQYKEALEKYLELLDLSDCSFNIARNCYKIGLCYNNIKKNSQLESDVKLNRKMAVKYLTLASEIAKADPKTADYFKEKDLETIVLYVGNNLEKDSFKPRFNMSEDEFFKDDDYKDLFDNYDCMREQVLSGQISIDDIGSIYSLTKEDELIFQLLIARELYQLDHPKIADEIISRVQKEKNKPRSVKSLYKDISERKRFYKYSN